MRLTRAILYMLIGASFLTFSCGSDDDAGVADILGSGGAGDTFDDDEHPLIGRWVFLLDKAEEVQFHADSTYTEKANGETTEEGTWTLAVDDSLTMVSADGAERKFKVDIINLAMDLVDPDGQKKVFTKQTLAVSADQIVGTWESVFSLEGDIIFVFDEDASYVKTLDGETVADGTWELVDVGVLNLTDSSGNTEVFTIAIDVVYAMTLTDSEYDSLILWEENLGQ